MKLLFYCSYFRKTATRFIIKNSQYLMDKRCFWSLSIFSIQNRSSVFGFVPLWRQLILYRFLGYLSIHSHQFECRQKKKKNRWNLSTSIISPARWKRWSMFFMSIGILWIWFSSQQFNQKYINIVFILSCFH